MVRRIETPPLEHREIQGWCRLTGGGRLHEAWSEHRKMIHSQTIFRLERRTPRSGSTTGDRPFDPCAGLDPSTGFNGELKSPGEHVDNGGPGLRRAVHRFR